MKLYNSIEYYALQFQSPELPPVHAMNRCMKAQECELINGSIIIKDPRVNEAEHLDKTVKEE